MPPRKRAKPSLPVTEEEERINSEATRLRSRAECHLLQKNPPGASTGLAPSGLRRCDGQDIVKRNASRKKKYLFVFPGAASLPPGATVGSLAGLDTRTPTLDIDIPPAGRIRLSGSLVFPKNCFTAVKVPASKKKPVNVVDTFETLVVFSEWSWIGDPKNNPGGLPEPLPLALKRPLDEGETLWKLPTTGSKNPEIASGRRKSKSDGTAAGGRDNDVSIVDDTDDVEEIEDDVVELDEHDGDSWDQLEGKFSTTIAASVEPRSNPRRKRKQINYADTENDSFDCMDGSEERESLGDKHDSTGTPDTDDPGYAAEADLDDLNESGAF